jgi:hypothetical protein
MDIGQKITERIREPRVRAPLRELAPLNSYNWIPKVWNLFFKDYAYLNKLLDSGIAPILVGSALKDIFSGNIKAWERPHLCLVCPGEADPELFEYCLQPHELHTHGGMLIYDYAFDAHNITLSAACAHSGSVANPLMTRWPEKLSMCGAEGRRSSYLVYGERQLRVAGVHGLGRNLDSDESVSRVCCLQFSRGGVLLSNGPYCFEPDPSGIGYRYVSDYKMLFQYHNLEKSKRYYNPLLEKYRCKACSLKGDATFDR